MRLFSRNHSGMLLCGSHHTGRYRYGILWSSMLCESKGQKQSGMECSRKCSQIPLLVLRGQRPLTLPEGDQNEGLIIRILHCKQYSIMKLHMVGGRWDLRCSSPLYGSSYPRTCRRQLTWLSVGQRISLRVVVHVV